jgi:hypothetical protein
MMLRLFNDAVPISEISTANILELLEKEFEQGQCAVTTKRYCRFVWNNQGVPQAAAVSPSETRIKPSKLELIT